MSGEPVVKVPVRLPPEMHAEIKQRAKEEDRSMSQFIRRAIREYLAANA